MELYTPVTPSKHLPRCSQADSLMLFGSCFATEIGQRLCDAKFRCDVNPYGVLYNPASIATALREVMEGAHYTAENLFELGGCWHSPMHHSSFSDERRERVLEDINLRLEKAHTQLASCRMLLLTWGTAYVYTDKRTGRVVGNCHKRPERAFARRRLSVEEIVEEYTDLITALTQQGWDGQMVCTVSPIRHIRDGLHENQLSKATLLLAIDRLQQTFPDRVFYFPAYEIVLDELRDYRFYAEDMVHPSELAVRYVWQRFTEACLTAEARQVAAFCEEIHKALAHKPFRPESEEYKRFLGQIVLKIEQISGKYPYLDFQNEKELCRIRLKA